MSANEIRASFAFPFVINRLKHYSLSRGTISLPKATASCKVISAFKLRSVFLRTMTTGNVTWPKKRFSEVNLSPRIKVIGMKSICRRKCTFCHSLATFYDPSRFCENTFATLVRKPTHLSIGISSQRQNRAFDSRPHIFQTPIAKSSVSIQTHK